MPIAPEIRVTILRLARESVAAGFKSSDSLRKPLAPADAVLSEPRGAFVTIHRDSTLRGCIGLIESDAPLWKTVMRMARSAAFEDPRFDALTADELLHVDFEVSVLTPVRPVTKAGDIIVGTHGLIVQQGVNKGLFLPQVPVEQGWDHTEFLEHTCVKAGLPPGAWKDQTTSLSVFSAEVFSENDEL